QVLRQQQALVVEAVLGAVAAAEDGDAVVVLDVEPGDVLDAGRLAGAADAEIADAHHRLGGPVSALPPDVKELVAPTDAQAIWPLRQPQAAAGERRPQAAALAAGGAAPGFGPAGHDDSPRVATGGGRV